MHAQVSICYADDMTTRAGTDAASDRVPESPWVEGPHGIRHPSPAHAHAFLGLIRAGHALERGLDADLRRTHGMSLRAYEVLLHLAAFAPDQGLRITQLTEQAPLSQSRVSRLVDELEGDGLINRTPSADDGRGVAVRITDTGLARLREVQDTHHDSLDRRLFSRLDPDQIRSLGDLTDAILSDPGT